MWLALALLVVPLAELFLILEVGRLIGGWPTVLLLLAESALGAWLLRREGPAAWRRLQEALRRGRLPSAELTDAALVLVGGTLLLTPGFLTDVVGFFCVLPPTRPLARRLLLSALRRRVRVVAFGAPGRPRRDGVPGEVVPGEVVDRPPGPERKGPAAPGG
jgi:UPF0716 protein FxsA